MVASCDGWVVLAVAGCGGRWGGWPSGRLRVVCGGRTMLRSGGRACVGVTRLYVSLCRHEHCARAALGVGDHTRCVLHMTHSVVVEPMFIGFADWRPHLCGSTSSVRGSQHDVRRLRSRKYCKRLPQRPRWLRAVPLRSWSRLLVHQLHPVLHPVHRLHGRLGRAQLRPVPGRSRPERRPKCLR